MPWTKVLVEKEVPDFDDHPGQEGRKLSLPQAVRETLDQALGRDPRVFVMGQGVDDPGGMFGLTLDLHKKYGGSRVFDTPLAENALTGMAVGAALTGMKPVYFHNRPDFLLLTMDQIVNHAAKYSFMFGGQHSVPLIIAAVIGRGWGSGAQHSQALHGLFMHVPGIRLALPSTAYDAKGLLVSALSDRNPVIFLMHRWSFKHQGKVPDELYAVPFGRGVVRRSGRDATVVAVSYMVTEALRAAADLEQEGLDVEVIDPRTLAPLDEQLILASVKKTGHLVVADTDWKTGGATAEIAAMVFEKGFEDLRAPVRRVAWPDLPVPSGHSLEEAFYPGPKEIAAAVREVCKA